MALIKCAECGKEFSDRANACPNCGCPIEYQAEKSIGGEYHAADKLAPSVIVEHLMIAKELESERYTLLCTIDKLQAKINRLGVIRAISKTNYNVRRKTWIAFIIASIFSCAVDEGVPAVHGLHPAAAWTWVQARRLASRPEVKVVGFTPSFVRFVTGRAFLFVQTARPVFLLQGGQLI